MAITIRTFTLDASVDDDPITVTKSPARLGTFHTVTIKHDDDTVVLHLTHKALRALGEALA